MIERDLLIDAFLAPTQWAGWQRKAIAGDASARRYFRLTSAKDTSAILMDAPPENGEDTTQFAQIAQLLTEAGLRPPEVFLHDPSAGLMLISDLGADDFASWLRDNAEDQHVLYTAATDVLVILNNAAAPDDLVTLTPNVAAEMVNIVGTHYTRRAIPDLTQAIKTAFAEHAPDADTLALRDFHAENLIWRPERQSTDRVGLLDFQDAFIAPAGYDLASLLRDVRRDIPANLFDEMVNHFCAQANMPPGFRTQLACLSVQRNLRILGVFARLATVMGKPRYLEFMPRVWHHICTDLEHPALAGLKDVVLDCVPAPTTELLNGFAA